MTASSEARRIAALAARAAAERKAQDVVAIDVSDVLAISDAFVIASADNDRQVRSIVDEVDEQLSAAGLEPKRREGGRENRWVLLDYGVVVVHVQRDKEREFYALDRLYRDCPLIEVEGLETPERPGQWEADSDPREARSIDDIPLAEGPPDEDEF